MLFSVKTKFSAFVIHLLISVFIAILSSIVVFLVWYPYPYREISSGKELFTLLISIDVVLGPLLTFIVFNYKKSKREKIFDFSMIALLQTGALFYGLITVSQARPIYTVFEYDRFSVVHTTDVPIELVKEAKKEFQEFPWTGPVYLSLRPLIGREQYNMTVAALEGLSLSARPELWRSYDEGRSDVLKNAKPISDLIKRFESKRDIIEKEIKSTGVSNENLAYLPLVSRKTIFWTILIDKQTGNPVGFIPIDPY